MSFDELQKSLDTAEKDPNGAAGDAANGAELAQVQAEVRRLAERIRQLEEERDAYQHAVYAYERERITEADLQRYAQHDDGLPLEAFLNELKAIGKENSL